MEPPENTTDSPARRRKNVQHVAHFQQVSRPGAKGNAFARIPEEPRREAACVLCQRKGFIEHRHKLNLFGQPPSNHQASTCSIGGAPQPAEPSSRAPEDADVHRGERLVESDGVARRQPDPRLVSAGRVAADPAALGQGEPVAAVAADNLDTDNIDMCWRFTHFSVVTNYSTYSVDK